jgi:hypothetical protein
VQAHAEQTLEEGTRALPANLRGEIYLCATTVVQRIAAKRDHHPGKSGQRHSDLGSDRQGFTLVLSVCIRQDSGGANKHEVRAGPALFQDSSAMMLRIRNAATYALAISAFRVQRLGISPTF